MRVTIGSRPGESGRTISPVRRRSLKTAPGGALSPIFSAIGSDRFRYDAGMRRFAAFSAKRNWRQIWTIGFHHEFPQRDLCRDFSHGRAVFKGDNSRERNEVVKIENFVRLIERAAKTMKNT